MSSVVYAITTSPLTKIAAACRGLLGLNISFVSRPVNEKATMCPWPHGLTTSDRDRDGSLLCQKLSAASNAAFVRWKQCPEHALAHSSGCMRCSPALVSADGQLLAALARRRTLRLLRRTAHTRSAVRELRPNCGSRSALSGSCSRRGGAPMLMFGEPFKAHVWRLPNS